LLFDRLVVGEDEVRAVALVEENAIRKVKHWQNRRRRRTLRV
jgi:hypothetical protein